MLKLDTVQRAKMQLIDKYDVALTHAAEPLRKPMRTAYITGLNHMLEALTQMGKVKVEPVGAQD